MSYLIKGILIGLLFGVPVGAVGTMTVHRTLCYGFRAGLITGFGSSVADCFYACIGAFGLTLISEFLLKYQTVIYVLGGTFILLMGIRLLGQRETAAISSKKADGGIKMFLSSFTIGITNPAAILTFLFAFSYFGIAEQTGWINGIPLVAGVFIGTYIWWGALSAAVNILKKKTQNLNLGFMNSICGIILILFGASVYLKLFFA